MCTLPYMNSIGIGAPDFLKFERKFLCIHSATWFLFDDAIHTYASYHSYPNILVLPPIHLSMTIRIIQPKVAEQDWLIPQCEFKVLYILLSGVLLRNPFVVSI